MEHPLPDLSWRYTAHDAWLPLCIARAAVILCAAAGMALDMAWNAESPEVAVPLAAQSGEPLRCLHCGWIESRREIEAGGTPSRAMSYEYTVRMTDGSSRVFEELAKVRWRMRERLIFIDGASTPD